MSALITFSDIANAMPAPIADGWTEAKLRALGYGKRARLNFVRAGDGQVLGERDEVMAWWCHRFRKNRKLVEEFRSKLIAKKRTPKAAK